MELDYLFVKIDADAEAYIEETLNSNVFSSNPSNGIQSNRINGKNGDIILPPETERHFQDLVLYSNTKKLLATECNRYDSNIVMIDIPATESKVNTERSLPFTIPVQEILPTTTAVNSGMETLEEREQKLRQLKKDIVRDRLIINSFLIAGAVDGLDGVTRVFENEINKMLVDLQFPGLPKEIATMFIEASLLKASRTSSGAIVIQSLMNAIDPANLFLIPQSSIVPPLKLAIQLGNQSSNDKCWGVLCSIKCDFIYLLSGIEEQSDEFHHTMNMTPETNNTSTYIFSKEYANKTIKVSYEDEVFLGLEIVKNSILDYDLVDESDSGRVTFSEYMMLT